jgi:hypothetical protein
MTKTLRYILIFLFISPTLCFSQTNTEEWRYEGPRIGIDLSRFLLPYLQSGKRFGWEIQGDIPYKGSYFPTVEFGMQWYDDKEYGYHYMNNGAYGRLGMDINIVKFESLKDHDIVFVGFRYGYSHYSQEADNIIYSNYWDRINAAVPRQILNAHWFEIVFGMKGEIFPNVFLGWSLRAKFPFYQTKDPYFKPFIIPGLGRTTGEVPTDFSFTLSYRIPMFKTKNLPKPLKVGGAKHPNANKGEDQGYPGGTDQYPQGQGNIRY